MKAKVRTFNGTTSPEVTQRETDHRKLAREAAAEGFVLLENKDHFLPLAKGSKVGLYGAGAIRTIKGGTGSGDVNERDSVNIFQGMKNAGYDVTSSEWLEDYDKLYVQARLDWKNEIFTKLNGDDTKFFDAYSATPFFMPSGNPIDEEKAAADGADTAFFVLARIAGENKDRFDTEGDYFISKEEKAILAQVSRCYKNVVLVINTGGLMDLAFVEEFDNIRSILQYVQAGQEGGNAFADVVSGDVTPSGKMTDTWAKDYYDYPGAEVYSYKSGDLMKEKYEEGIFVGYRYFDTFEVPVRYSFGYGMSYTDFEIRTDDIKVSGRGMMNPKVSVTVTVTNTGDTYAGKEVVQLYYGAPQGKLGKPAKELGAYRKTRLLQPGETQRVVLSFTVEDMASFDDLGKVAKSAYVLEAGSYVFYVGNNVRDAKKLDFTYDLAETKVTAQYTSLAAPHKLEKRLLADGTYEALPTDDGPVEEEGLERQDKLTLEGFLPAVKAQERKSFGELMEAAKTNPNLMNVVEGKETLDEFVDKLPTEALIHLLGGQPNTGVANTFGMGNLPEYGIPNIMTADGPAGLRIQPQCGVNTTAWPCATLLACTWDPELIEEIGKAGGEEVKENNIGIWLTPAVNIHRSPLCGRNFEYYSEDPLVAGKSGAAMVRGMQSEHIGASVKHFCCNNKETNRKDSDSRVSERALREIYLKAFEIIVKEADPYTIMSSYNLINGVQASENKDLLTGILRGEWDFKGMVTTDWWTHGEHYRETKAGNDIKMANGYEERVQEAFEKGYITRDEIALCAKRILTMILRMD